LTFIRLEAFFIYKLKPMKIADPGSAGSRDVHRGLSLLFVILCTLVLSGGAAAATHFLKPLAGQSVLHWQGEVTIGGEEVEFLGEELDFNNPGHAFSPYQVLLYRAAAKAKIRVRFEYLGSEEIVPGSIVINGTPAPNGEYEYTADLTEPSKTVDLSGWFSIGATTVRQDAGGEPVYSGIANSYYARIHVYKTLAVELVHSGGYGVRTSRRAPRIVFNETDSTHSINEVATENWGPAEVEINATGDLLLETPSPLMTGPYGRAQIAVFADTSRLGGGQEGLISGTFKLLARRGTCVIETTDSLSIPFAKVTGAQNASLVVEGPGGDELSGPLFPGQWIKAGDKVQVGTRAGVSGWLAISFANGQDISLAAEPFHAFKAVINGPDNIQRGSSLLTVKIKNAFQQVTTDPRRVGRMLVYKSLGNLVDGALGVPNGVGWITETPGNVVEEHLIEYLEPRPIVEPPPSRGDITPMGGEEVTPPAAMATRTEIEFFNDDSAWVRQTGGGALRVSGSAGSRIILPGAGTRVLDGLPGVAASLHAASRAPNPGVPVFEPSDGQVVSSRQPEIAITIPNPEAVIWETLSIRLDGLEIAPRFSKTAPGTTAWNPTLKEALGVGPHTLELSVRGVGGSLLDASCSFSIVAPPSAATGVLALACKEGVWLSWTRGGDPAAESFEVWRQPVGGGASRQLAAGLMQPVFLDTDPIPSALYTVRTVDPADDSHADAPAVLAEWHAHLPNAPLPSEADAPTLTLLPEGIRVVFRNRTGNWGRFRVERRLPPATEWHDLLADEWSVEETMLDTAVLPGQIHAYRVICLGMDGTAAFVSPAAEIVFPSLPTEVTGLRVAMQSESPGGALLRWNRCTGPAASALRVERDSGDGFRTLDVLPADATLFLDMSMEPGGMAFYRIVALSATGEAGIPSVAFPAAMHAIVAEPTLITADPLTEVPESAGSVRVRITRSGNLSEPATIGYRAETDWYDHAFMWVDFEPASGWLQFAPFQTSATVEIPILRDALVEPDETFSIKLFAVLGATEPLDPDARLQVRILDQDQISFEFSGTGYVFEENAGQATILLQRLVPSDRTVSVEVAVNEEQTTAIEGIDYAGFSSGSVTFGPGQLSATFTIQLLDDELKDGHKTLALMLQNPGGGGGIVENRSMVGLVLRDDETHAGTLRFADSAGPVLVPVGSTQTTLVIERLGGSDGQVECVAWIDGGSIPWDGAWIEPIPPLEDGQTTGEMTIRVDPQTFNPRRAPFLVITMRSSDDFEQYSQAVVVFPREGGPGSGFADWVSASGLPPSTGCMDDHDRDGVPALVEFALGTSDMDHANLPVTPFMPDEWGNFGGKVWVRYDPGLVVYAEFSDKPGGPPTSLQAGWEEDTDSEGAVCYFGHFMSGSRIFARIRCLWLDHVP
jgi:hypothetical protein